MWRVLLLASWDIFGCVMLCVLLYVNDISEMLAVMPDEYLIDIGVTRVFGTMQHLLSRFAAGWKDRFDAVRAFGMDPFCGNGWFPNHLQHITS